MENRKTINVTTGQNSFGVFTDTEYNTGYSKMICGELEPIIITEHHTLGSKINGFKRNTTFFVHLGNDITKTGCFITYEKALNFYSGKVK